MIAVWPPPPDRESIRELVRNADVERLIELHAAPGDEYDTEADEILAVTQHFSSAELTGSSLMPILEAVWRKSFCPDDVELASRRPALQRLAGQIVRFFGVQAEPQTRGTTPA